MTPKQLLSLLAAAVILAGVYLLVNRATSRSNIPADVGKPLLGATDLNAVARLEITANNNRLEILRDTNGVWRVPSLAGYPADFDRLAKRLRDLADVKISDVPRGITLTPATTILLSDGAGKQLISLQLGQPRQKNAEPAAMMWQPPEGRYLRVGNNDKIFLVKEDLGEFTTDPRAWVDTLLLNIPASDLMTILIRYADSEKSAAFQPKNGTLTMNYLTDDETFDTHKAHGLESAFAYLNFIGVLPASTPDTITGLSTGVVFRANLYNGDIVDATIGNAAPDGNRYAQFSIMNSRAYTKQGERDKRNANLAPYIFTIPAHIAANMTRPRAEFIKPVEKPFIVSEPVFIQANNDDDEIPFVYPPADADLGAGVLDNAANDD